jgi:hypothetical protein
MDPIEQLRGLLKGQPLAPGSDWTVVLKALRYASEGAKHGDRECQRMLYEFLEHRWSVPLMRNSRVPHSMPPEEMLLRQALVGIEESPALEGGDRERIKESLQRIVSTAVSPSLSQFAQEYLSRLTLLDKV